MIPTLTISIDRADMALTPLAMGAGTLTDLTIVNYTEPPVVARVAYAPTSRWLHGDMPLGTTLNNTALDFTVAPAHAATEQDAREAIDELAAAIARLTYEVTVTVNDADPLVWTCYAGGLTPAGPRTFQNLRRRRPTWNVSLPAHPIPA